MRRDEKCIVPDCDEGTYTGAKPIYIQLTVDGKRTWKKVGALCENHLPPELFLEKEEKVLKPGDVLRPGEKVTIPHDFPGQEIVDQVLPQKNLEDAKLSVKDWRAISELGKKVLPGTGKVHCEKCGCDNVPDYDNWDHPICPACGELVKVIK